MKRLQGKTILITGASSGLGAEMAAVFAGHGASVGVVGSRNPAGAEAAATAIRAAGGDAQAFTADISDEAQVEALLAEFVARFGGIDVLVNNAAIVGGPIMNADLDIHDMDLELWERTMAVNLRGPMLCSKHALRAMLPRKQGTIINISTTSAQDLPEWVRPAYTTSKAGLNLLTKYTAARYGHDGIRCNAILPGMILTQNVIANNLTAEDIARLGRHQVVRDPGTPADVAAVALLLASGDAPFLTGTLIPVDGGVHCHFPSVADDRDAAQCRVDQT
ncbi:MAG: SDR family oxidoreductase [Sphingomonadaceae bacterium]|nr:SDR family oxidoreductase [Sphingomonadaceae bacterium]